jgi:hypothetical protein
VVSLHGPRVSMTGSRWASTAPMSLIGPICWFSPMYIY